MNILIIGNTENPCNLRIVEEARNRGDTAVIAFMTDIEITTSSIIIHREKLDNQFDVVLFRGMHPQYISAYLTLAQALSRRGITVANPTLTEKPFVWNKLHQMLACHEAGIRVPRTTFLSNENTLDHITSFPVILKPIHGSHGTDIVRCDTMQELRRAAARADFGTYLVQDYLDANGDYRVFVVGGKAIGAVYKIPTEGEFRTNTDLGARFESSGMTREMRYFGERCAALFNLPVAGVDMRTHNNKLHVIEVNRNPGFEHFEKATNINVAEKIVNFLSKNIE